MVFQKARVCVFCDGDFWHGRNWDVLRRQLARRANNEYWIPKIGRNRDRDRQQTLELEQDGWVVVRVWETDVIRDLDGIVELLVDIILNATHGPARNATLPVK